MTRPSLITRAASAPRIGSRRSEHARRRRVGGRTRRRTAAPATSWRRPTSSRARTARRRDPAPPERLAEPVADLGGEAVHVALPMQADAADHLVVEGDGEVAGRLLGRGERRKPTASAVVYGCGKRSRRLIETARLSAYFASASASLADVGLRTQQSPRSSRTAPSPPPVLVHQSRQIGDALGVGMVLGEVEVRRALDLDGERPGAPARLDEPDVDAHAGRAARLAAAALVDRDAELLGILADIGRCRGSMPRCCWRRSVQ